jgi:hypothetical protein
MAEEYNGNCKNANSKPKTVGADGYLVTIGLLSDGRSGQPYTNSWLPEAVTAFLLYDDLLLLREQYHRRCHSLLASDEIVVL